VPKGREHPVAPYRPKRRTRDRSTGPAAAARRSRPGTLGSVSSNSSSSPTLADATPDQLEALAFPLRSRWEQPHSTSAVASAEPVTACLLSWKRPKNLEIIVDALRRVEIINEILIWNNNPDIRLEFADAKTRVIQSADNQRCYGRFLCAAHARNSLIYVQDDDVLNHDIAGLYHRFLSDPTRITHALSGPHWKQRFRHMHGDAHVALLGWGAIFHKDWLSILDRLPPSIRQDTVFLREADKFFTMLFERQHHSVLGDLTHLEGHSGSIALWRDPSHQQFKAYAVCQALRFLRLSRNPLLPVPWNVVITCRNYGPYLNDAVHSVLANDADYEIHIVDDCSTDETPEIAAGLAEQFPHVHYLANSDRRGPGYSRNRGIAASESEFVVLLDADDLIGPDYLYEAGRLLGSGADVVNPDAILFGARQARWSVPDITTLPMLLQRNFVHCCAAFRRDLWSQVGGIDEIMPCWMDYDLWIRLAAAGAQIQRLDGNHFFYRQHGSSLSDSAREQRRELQDYLSLKHTHLLLENSAH